MSEQTSLPGSGEPFDFGRVSNRLQESMDKFIGAASVEAVYGEPVRVGETTVIPAAEVIGGLGFGVGGGSGESPEGKPANGGGGGGGGYVQSRPVAVIIASQEGVRVEPVVDVTKISLAAFTAFGFMLATLSRMRRGRL